MLAVHLKGKRHLRRSVANMEDARMGRIPGQDGDMRGTVRQIQEEVEILGAPSPGAAGDHHNQTRLQLLASLPCCAGRGIYNYFLLHYMLCSLF